mgnify:CR=1 FL=1
MSYPSMVPCRPGAVRQDHGFQRAGVAQSAAHIDTQRITLTIALVASSHPLGRSPDTTSSEWGTAGVALFHPMMLACQLKPKGPEITESVYPTRWPPFR